MPARPLPVVFVHGWSVTHTDTYGHLPERLAAEAAAHGLAIAVRQIWLGEYVSFHDEVRVEDISKAFEAAVRRDLADVVEAGERFAAITHSTGGPVLRDWWWRFYAQAGSKACPLSHLVMLAPASFGSALAQLGKSRISRLKSWFQGVEPGQGVLDWLELGSGDAWTLNRAWIEGGFGAGGPKGVFPFVLTGQTIDRSLYDALNSYTGELGSDGVVRVPAANLNATYLLLAQQAGDGTEEDEPLAVSGELLRSPRSAFRLVADASHSGAKKGIMRSVGKAPKSRGAEVVDAILRSLSVATAAQYEKLCKDFETESLAVHDAELVEVEDRFLVSDRVFLHDRTTQVIFRVRDSDGNALEDFDLVLTGDGDDPNHLPEGFFIDRQKNHLRRNTITYFLNYDILRGCPLVLHEGKVVRAAQPGLNELGLRLQPRPREGFVHYAPARIRASRELADAVFRPDQTTLIDIVLRRIVHAGVVQLVNDIKPRSFKNVKPGAAIDEP